eukprot:1157989-Pelagomonas_calceolata.AAC.2
MMRALNSTQPDSRKHSAENSLCIHAGRSEDMIPGSTTNQPVEPSHPRPAADLGQEAHMSSAGCLPYV